MSEQIFSKKDIKGTVLNWSRYNFIKKKKNQYATKFIIKFQLNCHYHQPGQCIVNLYIFWHQLRVFTIFKHNSFILF